MIRYIISIRSINAAIFIAGLCLLFSCKKLTDIDPPENQLVSTNVFKDDASAAAVLTGIYQRLNLEGVAAGKTSISLLTGLSSDELVNFDVSNQTFQEFYVNGLRPENQDILTVWSQLYNYIYTVNKVIEGLDQSEGVSANVKSQLKGEALFLRAFFYFYLTNLFGDVPLIISTDYESNVMAGKTAGAEIYKKISEDLLEAKEYLPEEYKNPNSSTTNERVRPNRFAASALLARVYLYMHEYEKSEQQATEVLNNSQLYDTVPLSQVFLMNSKEAIWQIQAVIPSLNTYDGYTFILTNGPNAFDNPVFLSDNLLREIDSATDRRFTSWIGVSNGYKYPFKYKVSVGDAVTEYQTVLRIAEQYLIRAEVRAELGDYEGAKADVNIIRKRAGLPDTNVSGKEALIKVIIAERQKELFTEWGHRWLDIKRRRGIANPSQTLADEIMPAVCEGKGGVWNANWKLYPIPRTELINAPNLKPQNPGYN